MPRKTKEPKKTTASAMAPTLVQKLILSRSSITAGSLLRLYYDPARLYNTPVAFSASRLFLRSPCSEQAEPMPDRVVRHYYSSRRKRWAVGLSPSSLPADPYCPAEPY